MAIIIVFASSLLVAIFILTFKALESKFGKKNFILELVRKLDGRSEKLLSNLKFRAWQAIQSMRYLFVVKIKTAIQERFRDLQYKFAREYELQQNTIMGRRQIVGNGSASFYLKKIAEEKVVNGKGRIE